MSMFNRVCGVSPWACSSPMTLNGRRRLCGVVKTASLVSFRSMSSASSVPKRTPSISIWGYVGLAIAGNTIIAASVFDWKVADAEAPPGEGSKKYIRLSEVKQHGRNSGRKWVTKGNRVFDITEWIAAHPGGPVILQAVGGCIDPYWDIFTIHKKQDVYDILEEYFIGDIDPRDLIDGKVPDDKVQDPFVLDPKRDPRLLQHTCRPCNAETPAACLDAFITPNEVFYVRNHFWVPQTDEETHALNVELLDGTEKAYSLSDLKSKFKPFSITATLQCTGNRRKQMSENAKHAAGLPWDVGAISNATWTGVRLRDVLEDAGYPVKDSDSEEAKHVHLLGAEAYSGSIPIAKAVDPQGDVMLAYEMGGAPLPRDHGYPLRALVPGHTAARSVKWLEKIVLAEEECQSQWQQRDYKCFGPNQTPKDVDWASAPAIQETPVQSAITAVRSISQASHHGRTELRKYGLEEDAIRLEGYAFSGGGRDIIRVDVSADGGRRWTQAKIHQDVTQGHKSWSWRRWEWVVPRSQAGKAFVVKAVDESYNSQPESYEAQYNFRGNLTNAWHKIEFHDTEETSDQQVTKEDAS